MPMETGSGLVDEFDYTIKDAHFGHDVRFQNGETVLLQLTGINSETGSEDTQWLSCGKTWNVEDGGARLEYNGTGKKGVINNSTAYGKWIDSFMQCDGAMDIVSENDMDALTAASWVGLTLHIRRETTDFNIGGEPVTQKWWKVCGIEGLVIQGDGGGGAVGVEIPEPDLTALTTLAASSKSFEVFVDAAYEQVAGLTGKPYEDLVTDDSATGFYATHKG